MVGISGGHLSFWPWDSNLHAKYLGTNVCCFTFVRYARLLSREDQLSNLH